VLRRTAELDICRLSVIFLIGIFMNKFSQRLKELRLNKGDTQKVVAEYLDILPKAYQRYEYGEREPSFDTLIKICKYFDVSSDYLLGLSDIKEQKQLLDLLENVKSLIK